MSATEYPITGEVPVVRIKQKRSTLTELLDSSRSTFSAVTKPVRVGWNVGVTTCQWINYGWNLTAAPRKGYAGYRRNRAIYIADQVRQDRVDRLEAKADKIDAKSKADKIMGAAADLEASIERQRPMRTFIGYVPTLVTMAGATAAHMMLSTLEQGIAGVGTSALVVGAATVKGRKAEDLPEAVRPPSKSRPTETAIRQALRSLGIPELRKAIDDDPESIWIASPQELPGKAGWTTTIELPGGILRSKVMGARELLAQNLHAKHVSCLTLLEGNSTNEIELTLLKRPPSERQALNSELVDATATSFSQPFILGQDPANNPVSLMPSHAMLVVGTSGTGKTSIMHNLVGKACLDPTTRRILWDGKGGGDYAAFLNSLHYAAIDDARKHPEVMRAKGYQLLDFINDRAGVRSEILLAEKSDAVTPALLAKYPDDLCPLVFVFDEAQYLFDDPGAVAKLADLVFRIRSTNITIVIAMQYVEGTGIEKFIRQFKRVIVTQLSSAYENAICLGNKANQQGFDATDPNHTPGHAIIAGGSGGLRRVQVCRLTTEDRASIAQRAGVVEKLDLTPPAQPEPYIEPTTEEKVDSDLALLLDIQSVATPSEEAAAADPLCKYVIDIDELAELLRGANRGYEDLDTAKLRHRLSGLYIQAKQKNCPSEERQSLPDPAKYWRKGIVLEEVADVLERLTSEVPA